MTHQTLPSMGFPRQAYWSESPFHSPGDLPISGIKPESTAWQVDSFLLSCLGSLTAPVLSRKRPRNFSKGEIGAPVSKGGGFILENFIILEDSLVFIN